MRMGANGTFYIVKAEDRLDDNNVQVSLGLVNPITYTRFFLFHQLRFELYIVMVLGSGVRGYLGKLGYLLVCMPLL